MKMEMLKMSWERPIEIALLEFVRHMKRSMEEQVEKRNDKFLWIDLDKDIREKARCYVNAYETVEKAILREMEIRKSSPEKLNINKHSAKRGLER